MWTHSVHPGGRLLAATTANGLGFWDLETGRELAYLPLPFSAGMVLFEPSGDLLTNFRGGFFRWPVRPPAAPGDPFRVGPPQRLAFPSGGHNVIAVSKDGQVIAQAQRKVSFMEPFAGGWVLPHLAADAQRSLGSRISRSAPLTGTRRPGSVGAGGRRAPLVRPADG